MASRKSTKSRKRRSPARAPRAVVSTRRDDRAERVAQARTENRRSDRRLGTEGERPESPFGGLPISEVAIFAGIIGAVVGFLNGGGPALIVGLIVLSLGVLEITAREHLSGYRSHTALLALIPAVAIEAGIALLVGEPRQHALLLIIVVPIYAGLFWALRRRFIAARQARVARAARGVR